LKVSANVQIAMQCFEIFFGGQMFQMPPPGCAPDIGTVHCFTQGTHQRLWNTW